MSLETEIIDRATKGKATRLSFGEELASLGAKYDEVVALDADLSKSTMTMLFAEKFPKRFFNAGIAEANMIGMAAGLAAAGKIPFAASFGCFLTGRYDQIRMSVAFTGANVRLVGTHAGVGIGEDGHSQMALEDLTLMRSLPNMTVFQPADDYDTRAFMNWSMGHQGPIYMRLTRQALPVLKRANLRPFAPGRWDLLTALHESSIVVLASGALVEASIQAADLLARLGPVTFINANWIKPIDEELLLKAVQSKPKLFVTIEDHYRIGGLGGAIAEKLSEWKMSAPLLRIGVEGFGQSGSPAANYEHYGFTPRALAGQIEKALSAGQ